MILRTELGFGFNCDELRKKERKKEKRETKSEVALEKRRGEEKANF